ncbi:tetratricopeptide repeat protein [Sphingomonas sp. CJ99]
MRFRGFHYWVGLSSLVIAGTGVGHAQQATDGPDITVNAVGVDQLRDELADCIERQCPVPEEIDRTLALAENQFLAGDYRDATLTVRRGLHRNRRHRDAHPLPVSDLARAASRIASHSGDLDEDVFHAREVRSILKGGLEPTDDRSLGALLELGDSMVRSRRLDEAILTYRLARDKADQSDRALLAANARLRLANIYIAMASRRNVHQFNAQRTLAPLLASDDPVVIDFQVAARMMLARMAQKLGDDGPMDALVAAYRPKPSSAPLAMIHAPEMTVKAREHDAGAWADIGYWVSHTGKVSSAEVLRTSRPQDKRWVDPVVTAVRGRRYAPFAPDGASQERFRVERFSVVKQRIPPSEDTAIGSRIPIYDVRLVTLMLEDEPPVE